MRWSVAPFVCSLESFDSFVRSFDFLAQFFLASLLNCPLSAHSFASLCDEWRTASTRTEAKGSRASAQQRRRKQRALGCCCCGDSGCKLPSIELKFCSLLSNASHTAERSTSGSGTAAVSRSQSQLTNNNWHWQLLRPDGIQTLASSRCCCFF